MTLCEFSTCRNTPRWYIVVRSKVDGRIVARTLCTFHARRAERGEWVLDIAQKRSFQEGSR